MNFFLASSLAAAVLRIAAPFGALEIEETSFPARDFSVAAFGAKPDGTKCTEAFARAMAACEAAGGGRVVVPKGEWVTGAVHFRSNCDLHLEEGARLVFTDDPADYPEVFTTWEGVECYNHSPLIYALGCTNIAITGKGTIAPKMALWRDVWSHRPPAHMAATEALYFWCSTNAPMESRRLLALKDSHMRPHLIQFNRCRNTLLEGFRIRESPFWMIHLYHSENCIVRNLDTYAHGHNNDGVDVDMTKNVLIENCRFNQGDDGIVLKAGRNADGWRLARSTENVVVRDCDLVSSHSLLGIGSELSGGVRNVWMTRCRVAATFNMLRIKTGPRRGGFVENIWLDHCEAQTVKGVFSIFTQYSAQWGAFPDFELRRTKIRNINISDCTCGLARVAVNLAGDWREPARDITIRNVKVGEVLEKLTDISGCVGVRIEGLELAIPDPVFRLPRIVPFGLLDRVAARSPGYAAAVAFLRRDDVRSLPCGTYPLEGGATAEIREETLVPLTESGMKAEICDGDAVYAVLDDGNCVLTTGAETSTHRIYGDDYNRSLLIVPAGLEHTCWRTSVNARRARVCSIRLPRGR